MENFDGKSIAGYPIEKPIGEDCYGIILQAQTSADPIAIKILRSDLRAQADIFPPILAGLEKAKEVAHENLAGILGCGTDEEFGPYCLQAIQNDKSLRDMIVGGQRFGWRDALQFMAELAGALKVLHDNGIQHGNPGPGNIFLTIDMDVKLQGAGALTQPGLPIATIIQGLAINYMAPERLQDAPATPGTDIFGLGACLYYALAQQEPFSGKDQEARIKAVTTAEPPPLELLAPDVPPEVHEFVRRAMAKDPTQRYGTIDDFLSDLERVRKKETLAALRGGPPAAIPEQKLSAPATPAPQTIENETPPPTQATQAPKARESSHANASQQSALSLTSGKHFFGRLKTHVGSTIPLSDTEREGDNFFRKGSLSEAVKHWQKALDENGSHPGLSAKLELGTASLQKETFETAVNEVSANIQDENFQIGKDNLEIAKESAANDPERLKIINGLKIHLDQQMLNMLQRRKKNMVFVIIGAVLFAVACLIYALIP